MPQKYIPNPTSYNMANIDEEGNQVILDNKIYRDWWHNQCAENYKAPTIGYALKNAIIYISNLKDNNPNPYSTRQLKRKTI